VGKLVLAEQWVVVDVQVIVARLDRVSLDEQVLGKEVSGLVSFELQAPQEGQHAFCYS
jgi:hypothetical protein